MYRLIIATVLTAAVFSSVFAQPILDTQSPAGVNALVGRQVTAKSPVPARLSPPQGFLALPGDQVALLPRGGSYTIAGAVTLPHMFSTQTWVLLSDRNSARPLGWSYFGKDITKSLNFDVHGPGS